MTTTATTETRGEVPEFLQELQHDRLLALREMCYELSRSAMLNSGITPSSSSGPYSIVPPSHGGEGDNISINRPAAAAADCAELEALVREAEGVRVYERVPSRREVEELLLGWGVEEAPQLLDRYGRKNVIVALFFILSQRGGYVCRSVRGFLRWFLEALVDAKHPLKSWHIRRLWGWMRRFARFVPRWVIERMAKLFRSAVPHVSPEVWQALVRRYGKQVVKAWMRERPEAAWWWKVERYVREKGCDHLQLPVTFKELAMVVDGAPEPQVAAEERERRQQERRGRREAVQRARVEPLRGSSTTQKRQGVEEADEEAKRRSARCFEAVTLELFDYLEQVLPRLEGEVRQEFEDRQARWDWALEMAWRMAVEGDELEEMEETGSYLWRRVRSRWGDKLPVLAEAARTWWEQHQEPPPDAEIYHCVGCPGPGCWHWSIGKGRLLSL
jgi:hypothetical protein